MQVEKERDAVLQGIKNAVSAAAAANEAMDEGGGETDSAAAETAARTLDGLISRMHGLKRKLVALHDEEQALHSASRRRIEHLEELYSIPSLADVKYDEWSNVRLSRLLVDYLLRSGYTASARALATEKKVEELVDIEPFELCRDIETSLLGRRTQDCLAWCLDNRQALKKINVGLAPPSPCPAWSHGCERSLTLGRRGL